MNFLYILSGCFTLVNQQEHDFFKLGYTTDPRERFPRILIEIRRQCLTNGVVSERIVFNEGKSFLAHVKDKGQALLLESLLRKATKAYQHDILTSREYRKNITECLLIVKEFSEEWSLTFDPVDKFNELPSNVNVSAVPWWIVPPAQKPHSPADYLKQQLSFLRYMKKIFRLCDEIHQHSKQVKITINPTTRKLVQNLSWAGSFDIINNHNERQGILLVSEAGNRHDLLEGSTITIKLSTDVTRYLSSQANTKIISKTLLQALDLFKFHRI